MKITKQQSWAKVNHHTYQCVSFRSTIQFDSVDFISRHFGLVKCENIHLIYKLTPKRYIKKNATHTYEFMKSP